MQNKHIITLFKWRDHSLKTTICEQLCVIFAACSKHIVPSLCYSCPEEKDAAVKSDAGTGANNVDTDNAESALSLREEPQEDAQKRDVARYVH